jgi:hypothetical protein
MKTKLALALACLCAVTAGALDFDAVTGKFGVAVINIERFDDTAPSAPTPVVNTLGASFNLSLSPDSAWAFAPALDLLWTNYEWSAVENRALPTESEQSGLNNVFMLGLMLDAPIVWSFRFSERLGGAAQAGLAFLARLSFPGDAQNADSAELQDNLSKVSSYFWGKARWLYPSFGLRMDVFLQEGFAFALGFRYFLPLFNAWTGDAPFFDHGTLHITLGMRISV